MVIAFAVFVLGSRAAGVAFLPILLLKLPLVLVVLCPFVTNLVAVAAIVEPMEFLLVGWVTGIFQSLVGYYFGLFNGAKGMEKIGKWVGINIVQKCQPFSESNIVSVGIVSMFPGPLSCLIIGSLGFKRPVVLPAIVTSQVFWVTVCFWVGRSFQSEMELVLGMIQKYVFLLSIVFFIATSLWYGRKIRQTI